MCLRLAGSLWQWWPNSGRTSRALLRLFWMRLHGRSAGIGSGIQDVSEITTGRLGSPYFRLFKEFRKEKTSWDIHVSWLHKVTHILLWRTNQEPSSPAVKYMRGVSMLLCSVQFNRKARSLPCWILRLVYSACPSSSLAYVLNVLHREISVVHQIVYSATAIQVCDGLQQRRGTCISPSYTVSFLTHCYLECGPRTCRPDVTWELIRNADSQPHLPTSIHRTEVCTSTRSPGASYTPGSVKHYSNLPGLKLCQ